jgi:2-polyprenyl-3-methyl-5-hydroxy-6-metoxy-1,4-benzoquinol methylase
MPDDTYYRHVRREIASLLPARMSRVLEVGCGAGDTLRWLKESRPDIDTTGVEYNAAMREPLARNADHAFIGSVDALLPMLGVYDTILCLDVLEHLSDSDSVLAALAGKLTPDGCIIISLPNISHVSVSLPLLLSRRFPYADAGLLDRTHLRFFAEHSILDFVAKAGLGVDEGRLSGMQGGKARLANRLTFGLFRHHLTKQYIFRVRPGLRSGNVDWRVL